MFKRIGAEKQEQILNLSLEPKIILPESKKVLYLNELYDLKIYSL